MTRRLVSVAVPVPALGLLTYSVPESLPLPVSGSRVIVPLGRRTLTGVVIGEAGEPATAFELRDVLDVLDDTAFLPGDVLHLLEWVSEYYLAGPGATLAAAMPPQALSSRKDAFRTVRAVSLTPAGLDLAERVAIGPRCSPDELPVALGTRRREALLALRAWPNGASTAELASRGISSAVVARLQAMGLASVRHDRLDRDPFASGAMLGDPAEALGRAATRLLTDEQRHAVDELAALADTRAFRVALLHGVTGSGKTEVYLQIAARVSHAGRGVLMLVPEIALTPAIASVFRAQFGARVAIQHSGLSDGERHDQWHRIRRGDVNVVVGTRSAIFAPLATPGLIIVDEEHDTSYKQEETPRYHGRDVAVMRGQFAGALVVLGSATPSMESYFNAGRQRYTKITLTRRVLDRPLAKVRIVDMRREYADEGPDIVLARSLREAIADRIDCREQSLILLNRRGYASSVFCRQCGGTMECPNCSVSLTVHGKKRGQSPFSGETSEKKGTVPSSWRARCHYCNFARDVPRQCVNCAAPYLEHIGFGTERVEAEIARLFPGARVARIDRDTIRRRGALSELLTKFGRQELDVLVGTQMIAKGHDFPQVTLVGVISADVGLGLADFRASERTFQLLTQVAGRAGRGEQAGVAIIQTLFPTHYSIRLATSQDYPAFFDKEVAFRQAMRYPPTLAMVNVVVRGKSYDEAMSGAAALARRASAGARPGATFEMLGPAPAPLTRLRGEHRAQFFLKGTSRAAMRAALRRALESLPELARKTSVDVDPVNVL